MIKIAKTYRENIEVEFSVCGKSKCNFEVRRSFQELSGFNQTFFVKYFIGLGFEYVISFYLRKFKIYE